jgi:predicted permease
MVFLINDIKYAFRMMHKHPGFTVIALITLAIGIGANTIMFSLVNMLYLRPVHVKSVDELAVCQAENADWHFPYEAYVELRENNPVFIDVAAVAGLQPAVTWALGGQGGNAKRPATNLVSSNYFSLLGVAPAYGRWFLPEEERYGTEPVVVLSYRTWQRAGADPQMIGTQVLLNNTPFKIVGVAPQEFTGASLIGPDLWVPLGCDRLLNPPWNTAANNAQPYPKVIPIGRLRPKLNLESAQAQIQALVPALREHYPTWWQRPGTLNLSHPGRMVLIIPLGPEKERLFYSLLSLGLMAVSGVVLLIACINLAGMMIVQGSSRRREIAIRMALGGGRLRIIRQLLIECLLMSLAGGVLGCLVAWTGTRAVNAWIASIRLPIEIPSAFIAGLDGRVLLGTLGFCVIAAVLFGLRPALNLSKRDVMTDLKESGRDALRSTYKKTWAPRGFSVMAQTALSVVLVMGAGMFTHSALKVVGALSDFDFRGKLLIEIDFQTAGTNSIQNQQKCITLINRLQALPGIESVATSRSCNFSTAWPTGPVYEYTPGGDPKETRPKLALSSIQYNIGTNYFKTMGISLLQGRTFNELDRVTDAEEVVIIDEQLAYKLRPDGDALGCLIQYGPGNNYEKILPHRVVGIVQTLSTASEQKKSFQGQMYVPTREKLLPVYIHVLARNKTRQGEDTLIRNISQEIYSIDSQLPVITIETLKERYQGDEFVWLTGLGARLAVTFGAMALFLAALGIYAIKGYMVASRTPEIGIRKALGATRRNIILMVFREGSVLMLIGLGVGILVGLGLARLMESMFYDVSPVDPVSIVVTIVVLVLASLLAGLIPAHRAAKIDPMEALRYE